MIAEKISKLHYYNVVAENGYQLRVNCLTELT